MRERFAILNALYYSEGEIEGVYDEMSAVNNFRVIKNLVWGEGLEMLADEGYYSTESSPFDFTLITEQIESQDCSSFIEP